MAYPHHLETFIRDYLTARGAVVERSDYAVLTALVDTELENVLAKDQWQFAFDYDAAQESPGSEFITYGNAVLEKIINKAVTGHKFTLRYAVAPSTLPGSVRNQAALHAKLEPAHVEIARAKRYLAPVFRFKFKIAFLADDREEQLTHIWVDGYTGKVLDEYANVPHIFYEDSLSELLPQLPQAPPSRLVQAAVEALHAQTLDRRAQWQSTQRRALEDEIARTNTYFSALMQEQETKITKAMFANDQEQAGTLKEKLKSIESQRMHHIQDVEQKYVVRCDVELLDAVLYMVPRWRLTLSAASRGRKAPDSNEQQLFWDPILRKVVD